MINVPLTVDHVRPGQSNHDDSIDVYESSSSVHIQSPPIINDTEVNHPLPPPLLSPSSSSPPQGNNQLINRHKYIPANSIDVSLSPPPNENPVSESQYELKRLNYEKRRNRLKTPTKIRTKRKSTNSVPLSSIPLTKVPKINQSHPLHSISPLPINDINFQPKLFDGRRYHTYTFKNYVKSPLNPNAVRVINSTGKLGTTSNGLNNKDQFKLSLENTHSDNINPNNEEQDNNNDGDDESSGFIVGSSAHTYSQESSFPFRDLTSIIQSPHEPPFPVPPIHPKQGPVRQKVINQNNTRLFAPTDHFQEYIEERLIRWKPSDSQHNNESTIIGNHPFQSLEYDKVGKKNNKPFKLFSTLGSWFNPIEELETMESQDLEAGLSSIDSIQPSVEILNIKKINDNNNNYDKIIGNLLLKPNSSISILPLSQRSTPQPISNQPSAIQAPNYTPKGIPFKDYEINFEKRRETNEPNNSDDDLSLLDTLDDDVRHLVDGIDNFVINCIDGIWNFFSSFGNLC
ncbi:hypothetical protein DFJ63DRAFT_315389 [Scheffersomyces coipomensis]|uniref:uncharacterized protein n=1 Tax=Scheffersomyces coipomensis TaxID=1788519 RepID=UPI00315DCC75